MWPDPTAAVHRHVPFDPAASDQANINKLVEQVHADGEHMLVLKTGIERLHETVEAQAALLARHEQRLDEQAAVNLRGFKEHAELRGELTQRAVRMETATEQVLAGARGPAMAELIADVSGCVFDDKIAAISADMHKVKAIIEHHEARELEMASYLEGLAGERPTEGRFITGKFELYDRSFSQVKDELARQHGAVAEQFATAAAVHAVSRAGLEQMNGQMVQLVAAHDAFKASGNLAAFTAIQARVEAVEQAVKNPAVAGGSFKDSAVAANPFACGPCGADAPDRLPPGMPSVPACFSTARGGNGICHCVHLMTLGAEHLPDRVRALETRIGSIELKPGVDTFVPGRAAHGPQGVSPTGPPNSGISSAEPVCETPLDPKRPLRRRAIGGLASDKAGVNLFDDNSLQQASSSLMVRKAERRGN